MLRRLVEFCFGKKELRGYGACSKCPCVNYEDAGAGNSYCNCGHSYGDHW